jgi:O-antigen ligase
VSLRPHFGDASSSGSWESPVRLTPFVRGIIIALILVLAFLLGTLMDVMILIGALGLLNVGIIVFLLLKRDITWGFLFYLTAVIFLQRGFWIKLPGFPDLYPARIAFIVLFLVFLIQILLGMREVPRFANVEKAMIVFLVVLFISVVTSGQKPRWLLLLRGYVYPYLFYYFARAVVNQERQVRLVLLYLAFIGIYCGIMGIFEGMHWYELVFPKIIVDPSVADRGLARLGVRVRGIFLHPAVLGTVMTMGFFAAWLQLSRSRGIMPIITKLTLLAVTPLTIFFTLTRAVYAGFAGALAVGAIWSRRLRPLCIALLLGGMLAAMMNWSNLSSTERDKGGMGTMNTINYRIVILYEALEVFLDYPFFGCGFMNFTEIANDYRRPRDVPLFGHLEIGLGTPAVPHNILLTIVAEQGLAGIVPFFLIFYFIWRKSVWAYRRLPRTGVVSRDFVVCVWCAIIAYWINAMFIEMRYFEYVNVLFFFLMGMTTGMYERHMAALEKAPERMDRVEPSATPWTGRLAGRRLPA